MNMMLELGIVARSLNAPHIRGTGRYIYELLRHTDAADQVRWTVYGHDPLRALHAPPVLHGTLDIFDFRGDRFRLWEQIGLPRRARRGGVQVLHCAENTVPVWQPVPTVVTIHDTVPWAEPSPDRLTHHYLHHVQSAALHRCAAVITISESSRRDILARWPDLADRLSVVPHGIADEFFAAATDPLPTGLRHDLGQAPYIAYVGGPMPRKRFTWAMEVLERCGRPDLHLVACGFAAGTAPTDPLPEALKGRVHFAPFLHDGELVALYRGAVATLYPTLYEGFGFPAVEAQAAGTPALFSPVSSLADLVGPLAWAVDAHDMAAWLAALDDVLNMPPTLRSERAAKALGWARRFSWRRSVESHMAIYRDVHERGNRS